MGQRFAIAIGGLFFVTQVLHSIVVRRYVHLAHMFFGYDDIVAGEVHRARQVSNRAFSIGDVGSQRSTGEPKIGCE